MEETKKSRSDKIFRVLCVSNLMVMALVLFESVLNGISLKEFVPSIRIYSYIFIMPLAVVFLVINIWGVMKFPSHRPAYSIIIAVIVIWLIADFEIWRFWYYWFFAAD
jgi:hypothetical protein